MKAAGAGDGTVLSPWVSSLSGARSRWRAYVRNRVVVVLIAVAILLAAQQAGASELAAAARSLAENILGSGTVTSLAVADKGATIIIRWESATFRSNHTLERIREGLAAEAQLATGSILGRLFTVARVKFSIRRAGGILATGENSRVGGLRMSFADSVGGGVYVPKPTAVQSKTKSGGGSEVSY